MSTERLENLARAMIVEAGVAPSAVLTVGGRGTSGWHFRTGAAGIGSGERPARVDPETPFDLASVTKPIVASTVARLVRRGVLEWKTPLSALLPELRDTATGPVSLELLLAHRAGLDAHRTLYAPLLEGRAVDPEAMIVEAARARRTDCVGTPPDEGFPPLYSDLGYLLAGAAAARAAGQPLDQLIAVETSEPLGIDVRSARHWERERASFRADVAPTEVVPWRGGEVAGEVHDENAWAFSGRGAAGHAGLFGTAESVARFGAAFLDALAGRHSGWLTPAEAKVLTRPRPLGTLRAGFDGKSAEGSSAGSAFSERSFGHLGFTGTSVWCDPDADLVAVILTNRVNPSRENIAIRAVRPRLHDALFGIGSELSRL